MIFHKRKCVETSCCMHQQVPSFLFKFLLCFTSVSLNRESKDNQWLGVTVKSQGIGGKVVVSKTIIF